MTSKKTTYRRVPEARPWRMVTADECSEASEVTVSEMASPIPAPMGEMTEKIVMKMMVRTVLTPVEKKNEFESYFLSTAHQIESMHLPELTNCIPTQKEMTNLCEAIATNRYHTEDSVAVRPRAIPSNTACKLQTISKFKIA